jgi:hypothetical protein
MSMIGRGFWLRKLPGGTGDGAAHTGFASGDVGSLQRSGSIRSKSQHRLAWVKRTVTA